MPGDEGRGGRRPISRRIMVALFVLMMVPTAGWLFFADVASRSGDPELELLQREIRFKLALTLGASLLVLAAVIAWIRRSVLDRLEELARRARSVRDGWVPPEESGPDDEIADLAHALDDTVSRLSRRAEEATRFASNLSHELRTPLSAIRGAAEILAEGEIAEEDRRRFAGHVLDESARLERLVLGMIELARAGGARHEPGGPTDLGALLPDVARRCEPLLARRAQVLDVAVSPGLPPVAAPADLISRVLFALLENAMKYAPSDSRLALSARPDDGAVVVSVEDPGPGVPAALRERVFDRCFTTDPSTAGERGAGLGLAIARSLVESAGGRIRAETSSLGGAAFRFSLPSRGGSGPGPA